MKQQVAIQRQFMSAMDVWEWMTNTVHDPSQHPEITNKLNDLFDEQGRDNMQQVSIDIGISLSRFYLDCAYYDYERWGGPYEEYVSAMMEALYLWLDDFVDPTQADMIAMYTYVSASGKRDLLFNEFLSMAFEAQDCGEFDDGSEGYVCEWRIGDSYPADHKLIDHFNTVYGRGPDGLAEALVDFPPHSPWSERAVEALQSRQEVIKRVA